MKKYSVGYDFPIPFDHIFTADFSGYKVTDFEGEMYINGVNTIKVNDMNLKTMDIIVSAKTGNLYDDDKLLLKSDKLYYIVAVPFDIIDGKLAAHSYVFKKYSEASDFLGLLMAIKTDWKSEGH